MIAIDESAQAAQEWNRTEAVAGGDFGGGRWTMSRHDGLGARLWKLVDEWMNEANFLDVQAGEADDPAAGAAADAYRKCAEQLREVLQK